ncbi:MAG: histidine phosphatase family protein [Anaerolineae bacterium]|nr:histidine phosphatase family protein [Anaerolineae bacterium]
MIQATRISFVRHGTVHNPQKIVYGRLPHFALAGMGRRQAQYAAQAVQEWPIAAIYSSPLERAQETAHILAESLPGVPLHTSEWLNEVRFFYEGQPLEDMAKRNWDLYTGVPPEYEQPPEAVDRVRAFLAQARREHTGRHILAVSHGDVIAFATLWAHDVPLIPANKHTLDRLGLAEAYPAPGSITTFIYPTNDDERPAAVEYLRPYGTELLDTISPR